MSASNKKKFRKEQQTASMTEKQKAAKKEEKQLKIYTATFWIVVALCVCVVAGIALRSPVTSLIRKSTTAAVVGEHKLSAVELNYFFIDAINNYANQYGDYLSYFLDTTKPIGEQIADEKKNTTWADSFLDMAKDSAKNNYALYNAAKAAGYSLSEDEIADNEAMFDQLKTVAKSYGYNSATGYLKAMYGDGASMSSYRDYFEINALASSYYNHCVEEMKNGYDDAALRAFEADKKFEYNSYSYASYKLNIEQYKEGGTTNEDGTVTFSDEEIAAAEAAVKAAAEALAVPANNTVEALNAAIAAHLEEKNGTPATEATPDTPSTTSTCTESTDVLYSSVTAALQEWLADEARQAGDIGAVPEYSTSTDADGNETKTLKGYYVVIFQGKIDNSYALKNVRHILVGYEGGTQDENGNTTYSDEEKNAAKEKAEAILKEWTDGAKTEDSFAELAKEKSTDPGSAENGGLYEAVYPGQMVAPFEDWTFDETRKVGDTGIVQTDYGYHVMFFSGDNEISYRDYMIKNDLLESDTAAWQEELNNSIEITVKNDKHIDRDFVFDRTGGSSAEEDHEGHDHG